MDARRGRTLLAFTLGLGFVIGTLVVTGTIADGLSALRIQASDRYVAPAGADSGDCSAVAAPCASVQYAVDVASDGDSVLVAEGMYTGVQARSSYTQVVYLTRTVTIRGGFASDFSTWDPENYPTILNAERKGRVFFIGGNASPVIEGLYIIYGDAEAGGGASYGGGLLAIGSSGPSLTVTLRHSHFFNNYATTAGPSSGGHGGGLSFIFSNAILEGNTIAYNITDGSGGGLRMEQSNGRLRDNVIHHNRAAGTNSGTGGGIYLTNLASVSMTNTVIADNGVSYGGAGMVVAGAYARMVHTTLARNSGGDGSGIYVGIGGIHSAGVLSMTNSIVVSHSVGITVPAGPPAIPENRATLDGVLWYGNGHNTGGGGTINLTHVTTGTPAFQADGYHIGAGSAAINQGVDSGATLDIDGEPRPAGPSPDLGADEAWLTVFLPVILSNHAQTQSEFSSDTLVDLARSDQTTSIIPADGTPRPAARAAASLELYGTFHALGVIVTLDAADDPDGDATARVEYRTGTEPYRVGFPLSRIADTRLVGSLFWLEPGTAYDVRVAFSDPDGGPLHGATVEATASTRAEIIIPTAGNSYTVSASGSGTACTVAAPCALTEGLEPRRAWR